MSVAVFAKAVKNLASAVEINFNRRAGREFIPLNSDTLNIETSSTCNLACRFCAYEKKQSPKITMKDAFFADVVAQAVELGYRRFALTPCTGDIFMDRHVFNKLQMLDEHPDVHGYSFFTNFSVPDPDEIDRLLQLKKLEQLTISIYGHDLDSFRAITKSTEKVYRRLLGNLDALHARLGEVKFGLEIGFRSTRDAPRAAVSDLQQALARFKSAGIKIRVSQVYNNWGGYVTAEDVKGLALDITGTRDTYKNGPCTLLFNAVQVMATGIVNGCACRDVDAMLRIGDLQQQKLRDIISTRNQAYMNLIDEQMRGEFRTVCQSCDFYKSIFHMRSKQWKGTEKVQSMEQFKRGLDTRPAPTPSPVSAPATIQAAAD